MNYGQFEQGTPNRESHENDLVVLNNKVPIVYTTKLDDMWFFRRTINNVHKDDIAECIICESLPVLGCYLNVKPKKANFISYRDLKTKINRIFNKQCQKPSHKSQKGNLKKVQLSKQEKCKNVDNVSHLENKPSSESELHNDDLINMLITVIDCDGRQSLCTLSDLKVRLKDINLTIANRSLNEHDVYILDNDGSIKEFYTVVGNDTKLYEVDRTQNKVVVEFCCWVQRNKSVYKMYPNYLSLLSLKFILKPHKCLLNRCLCCCRNINDYDEPENRDQSTSSTTKSKKTLTKIETISSENWLRDLIVDKKYSDNLINKALRCKDMTTIRSENKQKLQNETKINRQTKKTKMNSKINNSTIKFSKLEKQQVTIYGFNAENESLVSVTKVNPNITNLKGNRKVKGFKDCPGCCWNSCTNEVKMLTGKKLLYIAELYRTPHLCPVDHCRCCCQTKPDNTNIKKMASKNQDHSYKTHRNKKTIKSKTNTKSKPDKIKSKTTKKKKSVKKTYVNMTITYVPRELKCIWEKFRDLRITITDEGRVSARVPRVSSMSTEEVKALSKILASAEERMKSRNFPPGTVLNIRIDDKNYNYVRIKFQIANKNSKKIDNLMDDTQESKIEIMDIEEQAISPGIVLESVKIDESRNIITAQRQSQQKNNPKVLEHQSHSPGYNNGFISVSDNENKTVKFNYEYKDLQAPKTELAEVEELSLSQMTLLESEIYNPSDAKNKINNTTGKLTNYYADKVQPAVEPTILSFKLSDAEMRSLFNLNNDKNNAIVYPRIENYYSLQSYNLPDNQSPHSTSANNNDSQEFHNSVSKRKLDEPINVQPKIRVVSPSQLGVDTESNSPTNFICIDPYALEPTGTFKSSKSLTKAKVTHEPNKYHVILNRAEVPKFTKILPKSLELPKIIVRTYNKSTPLATASVTAPMDQPATSPTILKKLSTKTPIRMVSNVVPVSSQKQINPLNVPKLTITAKIMENINKNRVCVPEKPIILKKRNFIDGSTLVAKKFHGNQVFK